MNASRTLSELRIAREVGITLTRRLENGCVRDLQRMNGVLLSGDDTILANTWDEICVQEQREHSFSWRAYLDTLYALVEGRIDQLQPYELDALWLLTPEGDEWDSELESERDRYPVLTGDIVDNIQEQVLTEANNWSNERIRRYLDGY